MSAPTLARGLSPARSVLPNNVVAIAQQNVAAGGRDQPGLQSWIDPRPRIPSRLVVPHVAGRRSRHVPPIRGRHRGDARRSRHLAARGRHPTLLHARLHVHRGFFRSARDQRHRSKPEFLPHEVEKRRAEAVTGSPGRGQHGTRSVETLMTLLYGPDHPYARPPRGTVASLDAIRREDLAAFHGRAVLPAGRLRVVVAGDVDPMAAIVEVARLFSEGRARPELEISRVAAERQIEVIPMPGKAQSDISYGFAAIRRLDPRYYVLVAEQYPWRVRVGGRLADNIRERQGMAYYAFSALDASVGEGQLVVRAGVDPNNVRRTIDAIDTEVLALATEGPTLIELDESRDALIGSIPRMLETNEGIATSSRRRSSSGWVSTTIGGWKCSEA